MHPPREVVPVGDGLVGAGALLVEDLDEDLHGADEDGGQGLDLLEVAAQLLPGLRAQQVLLPRLHVVAHLHVDG